MIYAGDDYNGTSSRVQIYDNHFSTLVYPNGGVWGVVSRSGNGLGNVWENNTWIDGARANTTVRNSAVPSPPNVTWNRPCPPLSSHLVIPQGSYLTCVDGSWNVYGNPVSFDSTTLFCSPM